jgi:hypothetical protein
MGIRKKLLERLGYVRLRDYGLHLTPDHRVVATRGVVLDDGYGACVVGWNDGDLAAAELLPWGASRSAPRTKALPAPPPEPPRASITLPPDPPRAKSITAPPPVEAPRAKSISVPPPIRAKSTTTPPVFAEATPVPAKPAPPAIEEEVDWETEIAAARARAEAADAARALVEATGASAARARAEAAARADAETEEEWEAVVARARAAAEAADPEPPADDTRTDVEADDIDWESTIARARAAAQEAERDLPEKPKFMPASSATGLKASSSSTKLPAAATTVALPSRTAPAPTAFTKALPNGTPPPDGDARPRTVIPVPALPSVDPRLVRSYVSPVRSGRR